MQAIQKIIPLKVQPMLMNVSQVADALGVSRGKVYQMILDEGLPVIPFGRKKMIRPDSLDQWLQSREQRS